MTTHTQEASMAVSNEELAAKLDVWAYYLSNTLGRDHSDSAAVRLAAARLRETGTGRVQPVTSDDAVAFIETACRNWADMPELSLADITDVAAALYQFLAARSTFTQPQADEVTEAMVEAAAKAAARFDEERGEGSQLDWRLYAGVARAALLAALQAKSQPEIDARMSAQPAEAEGLEVVAWQHRGKPRGWDWQDWQDGRNQSYDTADGDQFEERKLSLKPTADARITALQAEVERLTAAKTRDYRAAAAYYRDTVRMACDEAITNYKHEARNAMARAVAAEASLASARQQIEGLVAFANEAAGTALGIAMSTEHPDPTGALLELSQRGMAAVSIARAALREHE